MLSQNITESTCSYGLAQTASGCERTLASYNEDAYLKAQIIYLAFGIVTISVTGVMYYRSVKYDATKLQQHSFLLTSYAALTFIFRGADPGSYRHVVPRPFVNFFSDSCTSALYAAYILALGYWASIIQQGAAQVQRPLQLKWIERISITVIFGFYLVFDMCLFITKGFYGTGMAYVQMLVSASFLAAISAVFFVYGWRVLTRLRHFEHQKKIFDERNHVYDRMETARSFDMEGEDDVNTIALVDDSKQRQKQRAKAERKNSHAYKIVKILCVVESFAVIAVGAQMYVGVSRTNDRVLELDCANGVPDSCAEVECKVHLLHILQLGCAWIIIWAFRKIQKKEVIPGEQAV